MQVVQVRNPEIIKVAEVAEFIREAVKGAMFMGGNFDWAALDFYMMIQNPRVGTFLGEEDGDFKAFAVVALPQDRILPYPMVLHAFNKGSLSLGKAMFQAGVDFLLENGYDTVLAHNGAGVPDPVWLRAFKRYGKEITPIGTAALVRIK